ncbi:hypothetical protein VV869_06885 [Photobacterium sp. MCCC 1A19761]|uniref:hypothetical protein n=1 Tax=Photobacterium sp. MCCC 1A19761 TaxID=3115000 RepID=UPI00307E513E
MAHNNDRLSVIGLLSANVLSFWLLAAHFLRGGEIGWFLCLLLLPAALCVRQAWAARFVQLATLAVASGWVMITAQMLVDRLMMGDNWGRMLVIMGTVICLTLLSVCTFLHPALERRYRLM